MDSLFMALFMVAFIATPILIILLLVKKDNKYKKYLKISLSTLAISFIGFAVTMDSNKDEPEPEPETEAVEVVEAEEEEEAEPVVEEKSEEKSEEELEKEREEEERRKKEEEEAKERRKKEKAEEKLEKEYRDFVTNTASKYGNSFMDFSAQMETFNYSDEWIVSTAVIIAQIEEVSSEVINFDDNKIPNNMKEVHELYVLGAKEYSSAMDLFVRGFDSGDANMIEESSNKLQQGNEFIDRATSKLSGEL